MSDLSVLPEYPRFTPLAREHRELVTAAFDCAQPEISDFTFAYQWVWRPYTKCRLSRIGEVLLLMIDAASGKETWLLPPVTAGADDAAEIVARVLTGGESTPADSFARVPEDLAERLEGRAGLEVTEEPERADYVHLGDELRELPGPRFHGKRNHIRRFRAACPEAEYRQMDASLAAECAEFTRRWLEGHPKRYLPGLQREVAATLVMLQEREWLGSTGGCLVAGGRVTAFALGEPINSETFAVRVEKADTSLPGAYQAINQEFVRHGARAFRWINREQDLGVPGLRRAKQSYHPHHLVRKYRVRQA